MSRVPDEPQLPDILASDAERDETVATLKDHCVQGRLTLDELAERLDIAVSARTRAQLERVMHDLPAPSRAPRAEVPPLPTPPPAAAQARKRFVAILGSNGRAARWRAPEQADALAVMGECKLDLREALFSSDNLEITAVAIMGEVSIIVPEGMQVEVSGFAFMGANESKGDFEPLPGMPSLHVRAYSLMGSVEVKARPRRSGSLGPARP